MDSSIDAHNPKDDRHAQGPDDILFSCREYRESQSQIALLSSIPSLALPCITTSMASSDTNRPAPCSATDKESFAFESTARRWPTILTQAIDGLYQASSALSSLSSASDTQAKVEESKKIIAQISQLKHDIGRDRPLEKLAQDAGPSVELYNRLIDTLGAPTWFNVPWLFAECYLYRLLRSFFDTSAHWKNYDPFANQKLSAFRSSGTAIEQLAKTVEDLVNKAKSGETAAGTEQGQKLTFFLLAQSALWGNATDLSLLTSLTHADIQSLQAGGIGAEAQKGREKFILSGLGGLDSAWAKIAPLKQAGGGRVDIVLDNAGFELVTDLMLAQWLVETGHASEVVFHAKALPWFVSDVTPADFAFAIEALQESRFFSDAASGQRTISARDRSVSQTRNAQADVSDFVGGVRPPPAGSRALQYNPNAARDLSPSPAGSRILQADPKVASAGSGERGRGREPHQQPAGPAPAGSRSLIMDEAYFRNARSRTVSPSRSFLVDSTTLSFSDLAVSKDEDTGRGRDKAVHAPTSIGSGRPAGNRSASGFRSVSRSAAPASTTATQRLAATWRTFLRDGRFKLSVPISTKLGESTGLSRGDFWTEGVGYDQLPSVAPELLSDLQKSSLVIFKGDLNYRKLTADLKWPATTPFEQSLGDLAGKIDLLALRTCKADVVVGLDQGVEERVQKEDDKWRVNGKYAVVQWSARK
ncbi:unnamed protein product [Sympodiomycopsis kandeliae]